MMLTTMIGRGGRLRNGYVMSEYQGVNGLSRHCL